MRIQMASGWEVPAVLLSLALSGMPLRAPAQQPADFTGHWEGAIELPGQPLGIKVDLKLTAEGWSGTIDIPMQGARGLALADVRVDGVAVSFRIAGVPGNPTFEGALREGRISGLFRQSGQEFPFHLGREIAAPPLRPQEPEPPFPYRIEEVTVARGGINLAGTLTIPEGSGPFPAAVLISGSGAQDRDETIFGHKPFLVLADYLTRHRVAVLRWDDRGVGGSGGRLSDVTSADLAEDALAWVDLLAGRPEIDTTAIGLIGHSEGGIVGPLAARRSGRVAFVVMMAGTGVPGSEILVAQTEALTRAAGGDSLFIARQAQVQRRLLDAVTAGAPPARLQELLRALVGVQLEAMAEGPDKEAALSQAVAASMAQLQTPWMRYFISYDPRPTLRQVRVPVLVLNGELDLQVPPDQNLPEIERALREGGDHDVTVRRFPGLNHLFQPARTGLPVEYGSIETTIEPVVLETIRDWIGNRFGTPLASPLAGRSSEPADTLFASPERTVTTWLGRLRGGDGRGAAACRWPVTDDPGFPIPFPWEGLEVERRLHFGPAEVTDWNAKGLLPKAETGDVELTVRIRIRGRQQRIDCLLRAFDPGWRIIAWSLLGGDTRG
jgi:pimeloyl-ACP methyl ester carboxylesterase